MKYILTDIKTFAVVALFALALACGGKPATSNAPTNAKPTNANTSQIPANAPLGAQPPNFFGSATAAVTLEEFADYQCGSCAVAYPKLQEVKSLYGSRIKFIYRNFPLIQIHKNSYDAAVASEAAGAQGKFGDMQNQLFTNQQAWANSSDAKAIFATYAEKIGLDVERFKNDMLGMTTKSRVDADIQRGRALNINSTPTLFVNGKSIPFEQITSVDALKQIVDAEIQKAGTSSAAPATASATNTASNAASNAATNSAASKPASNGAANTGK